MENEASSLSEEATILIQRAIKTEFETQLLIQTLKQCHGPLALATEYCTDISEKLKFLASLLKKLEKVANEQDNDANAALLFEKIARHGQQIEILRGLFRTANHTFHVNLKEQAIQDRAQLLRYSVQNTASLYNTDESSSRDVLNASLGEKQQHNHQREQEHGQEQPLYSGSNSHGSNHKQQTLSVSEIRKRAAGSSSATSSQQRLVSTASDITSSLRNTTQLMTTQLQQSADMLNVLESSSKSIENINNEYKGLKGLISTGKRLITNIRRREITDNALIILGLVIFLSTVLYILNRRIFSRFY